MGYGSVIATSTLKDGFFRLFSFWWLGRLTGGGVAELSALQ